MSDIYKFSDLLQTTNTVFSTDDVHILWPGLSRKNLVDKIGYLVETEKIIRLKRGLYALVSREIDPFRLTY